MTEINSQQYTALITEMGKTTPLKPCLILGKDGTTLHKTTVFAFLREKFLGTFTDHKDRCNKNAIQQAAIEYIGYGVSQDKEFNAHIDAIRRLARLADVIPSKQALGPDKTVLQKVKVLDKYPLALQLTKEALSTEEGKETLSGQLKPFLKRSTESPKIQKIVPFAPKSTGSSPTDSTRPREIPVTEKQKPPLQKKESEKTEKGKIPSLPPSKKPAEDLENEKPNARHEYLNSGKELYLEFPPTEEPPEVKTPIQLNERQSVKDELSTLALEEAITQAQVEKLGEKVELKKTEESPVELNEQKQTAIQDKEEAAKPSPLASQPGESVSKSIESPSLPPLSQVQEETEKEKGSPPLQETPVEKEISSQISTQGTQEIEKKEEEQKIIETNPPQVLQEGAAHAAVQVRVEERGEPAKTEEQQQPELQQQAQPEAPVLQATTPKEEEIPSPPVSEKQVKDSELKKTDEEAEKTAGQPEEPEKTSLAGKVTKIEESSVQTTSNRTWLIRGAVAGVFGLIAIGVVAMMRGNIKMPEGTRFDIVPSSSDVQSSLTKIWKDVVGSVFSSPPPVSRPLFQITMESILGGDIKQIKEKYKGETYELECNNSEYGYRIISQDMEWNKKNAPYLYDGRITDVQGKPLIPQEKDLLIQIDLSVANKPLKDSKPYPMIYLPYSHLSKDVQGKINIQYEGVPLVLKIEDKAGWKQRMDYILTDAFVVNKGVEQAPMNREQMEEYRKQISGMSSRKEQDALVYGEEGSSAVPRYEPSEEVKKRLAELGEGEAFGKGEATKYFEESTTGVKISAKRTDSGVTTSTFTGLNTEPLRYEQVSLDGYTTEGNDLTLYAPFVGRVTDVHLSVTDQGILAIQCHVAPIEVQGVSRQLPARNLHVVQDISRFGDLAKIQNALKNPDTAVAFTFNQGLQIKFKDVVSPPAPKEAPSPEAIYKQLSANPNALLFLYDHDSTLEKLRSLSTDQVAALMQKEDERGICPLQYGNGLNILKLVPLLRERSLEEAAKICNIPKTNFFTSFHDIQGIFLIDKPQANQRSYEELKALSPQDRLLLASIDVKNGGGLSKRFLDLLHDCPKEEVAKLSSYTRERGESVFKKMEHSTEAAKEMVNRMSNEELVVDLSIQDPEFKTTPLQTDSIARSLFPLLGSKLKPEELKTILMKKDKIGDTALHSPYNLRRAVEYLTLPPEIWRELTEQKNDKGEMPLDNLAYLDQELKDKLNRLMQG